MAKGKPTDSHLATGQCIGVQHGYAWDDAGWNSAGEHNSNATVGQPVMHGTDDPAGLMGNAFEHMRSVVHHTGIHGLPRFVGNPLATPVLTRDIGGIGEDGPQGHKPGGK